MLSDDNKSMPPINSSSILPIGYDLLRSKKDTIRSSIKLFNDYPNTETIKLSPIKPLPKVNFLLKESQNEYRECNCKKEIQKLKERLKILTELIISSNKEIEDLKNKDNKENNISDLSDNLNLKVVSDNTVENSSIIKRSYISYLPYLSIFSLSSLFYFIKKRQN